MDCIGLYYRGFRSAKVATSAQNDIAVTVWMHLKTAVFTLNFTDEDNEFWITLCPQGQTQLNTKEKQVIGCQA
jgi:hypothetical protein